MVSKEEEFVCRRSRVLHNFKLPSLKWGSRKVMRCMKVDDVASARCRRRVSFRFSPEKLMFDIPATEMRPRREESETMKPWNLRTRRARLEPDVREIARVKERDSPVNLNGKVKSPWCLRGGGEKRERERARFSVSLSKDEIEEDFLAITGNRVPRRPKKRPRIVQKQLDMLFPGLWLTEVTADLYKVHDVTETGKPLRTWKPSLGCLLCYEEMEKFTIFQIPWSLELLIRQFLENKCMSRLLCSLDHVPLLGSNA